MFYIYLLVITKIVKCDQITVDDMANGIIKILGADNNTKLEELKSKLDIIKKYVTDKDKYTELIHNETTTPHLNETNFFNALNESDKFQFLMENEPKSLYLKLKEKMNRDDIMTILSNKTGRRMMDEDEEDLNDGILDGVVDKIIAETPRDDHTFDFRKEDNKYWDPQGELEDLKEHHQHDGRRIFKGERTTIKHYPFMVSIHVMGRFWCGGAIYWHDLVLTSASCLQLLHNNRFFRENPKALYVRIGSNHSRIGGEPIDALEVYFHPGYNPRTLRHNIAIIRLRRHLFFNYHRIPKIISISHNSGGLAPTSEILVLGWGVTKFLPIYPNIFCKEIYGEKFIASSMFCAGTITTGEGACDCWRASW
ncbi:unnamed protein product [Leptidea sinapis]|uniref:Peptidase S1 domain-containing protein n=1 Tax=Leptidea sinapis TaxID=189913 RepID=A0A5E4PUH6_9NEOP|nr:unnamed protein product [Leptidea sinapis]